MSTALQSERPTAPESESELLRQFAQGDIDAFESLFRQHQAHVYSWIICVVRDTSAAEDLTIETFWRIHRSHARFDCKRSFGAWARRIATNVAIDHLKKARIEVPLTVEPVSTPADSDSRRDLRKQTSIAFQRLPAKLQAVATLALVEEQPYSEIAYSLGISVSSVKTRVFRAVRRLRIELKKLGVEP